MYFCSLATIVKCTRQSAFLLNSVVDPYSFFPDPDPDPECDVGDQYGSGSGFRIRIQIQYGSRALMTKNWKKITAEKKVNFFWSKTAIYLSLGLHKVCPGYRRSLQLTKEAIQHFKTWIFSTFVGHFCPPGSGSGSVFKLRIRIRIQWSDWIRIQYGSGSRIRIRIHNTVQIFDKVVGSRSGDLILARVLKFNSDWSTWIL